MKTVQREWTRGNRRFLHATPQARAEWQVIGEALDGSEAIEKAKDLQPDLILLDIGLPILNGIGAADAISEPFISQNIDANVIAAVLNNGAGGYVHELHANRDPSACHRSRFAWGSTLSVLA